MIKAFRDIATQKEFLFLVHRSVTFHASNRWSDKFKCQTGIMNIQIRGDVESLDENAAAKYPAGVHKIIEENGYDKRQIWQQRRFIQMTGQYPTLYNLKKAVPITHILQSKSAASQMTAQ